MIDITIIRDTDSTLTQMHKTQKSGYFCIDILLSNESEYTNKHYKFNDNSVYELQQGDAIVYYSKGKINEYFYNQPIYIYIKYVF